MLIKKINITSFGRYQGDSYKFEDGINIVSGNNEAGKTTMFNFIYEIFNRFGKRFSDTGIDNNVTDYKPWYNEDRFEGGLDISNDGKDYILFENFLQSSNELHITRKDGYKFSKADMEGDEYKGLAKKIFIDLNGISPLSSDNFDAIMHNTKKNYVSIMHAADCKFSYDQTESFIQKEIEAKESDSAIIEIKEKLRIKIEEKSLLLKNQEQLKKLATKLFELRKQKETLEKETVVIDNSIKINQYNAVKGRYNKVIELEEKISTIEKDIDELVIFNTTSLDTVNDYIRLNGEIAEFKNTVKSKEDNIKAIKNEIETLELNADERVIRQMADSMYASDFIDDFQNFSQAQSKIEELERKLEDCNKEIELELQVASGEVNKFELEKDYFEALNNRTFENQLVEKKDGKKEITANEMELESLQLRRKPLFMYLVVAITVFIVFLVYTVALNPEGFIAVLTNVIMGVSVGAVILIVGYIYKYGKDIDYTQYMLEHMKVEYNKNQDTIKQYSEKNRMIFARHGFSNFAEFEDCYNRLKNENDSSKDLNAQMSEIKQNIELIRANKKMLYRRLVRWIDDTQLNNKITIDDDKNAIKYIEEFSKKCVKFINNTNSINRIFEDIEEDQEKILKLENMMSNSEAFKPFNNLSLDDIMGRKERYLLLSNQKVVTIDEQKQYLLGKSIEELEDKLAAESEIVKDIDVNEAITRSTDELKELLIQTKSDLTTSSQTIDELVVEIRYKSKEVKSIYEVNKGIADYERELKLHQQNIDYLKATLERIQLVAKDINYDFDKKFVENANSIMGKVTDMYEEIKVGHNNDISLREKGRNIFIPIRKVSLGTKDLVHFVLKLALLKTINGSKVEIPLVLDDAFIQFDDMRLESTLRVIADTFKQVIILTGQSREMNLCEKLRVDFNYVQL